MERENDDERRDAGAEATDAAWRAIVENYGERVELDDDEPPPAPATPLFPAALDDEVDLDGGLEDAGEPEEHFVPPPPPPLPRVAADRMVAWAGVFGSPIVLLAALVFSISLPAVLGYLLVAAFVGGFIYLVAKMPRGPRDPWDDGAQI